MSAIRNHQPDFETFLKVLTRRGRPHHLPFYEHVAHPGFIARAGGRPFDRMTLDDDAYWPTYVDFWMGLGFDCVPMEVGFGCPIVQHEAGGRVSRGSEAGVTITSMDEFESYPWPDPARPIQFGHFERVADLLPEGARIVGGCGGGPYEWVSLMMGVEGLSLAVYTQPELVEAMFTRFRELYVSAVRQLAEMDAVGALRQGDDLGFKTSTFLSPDDLRRLVLPIYRDMAAAAHARGKPFILHSCGELKAIYEDLIEDCRIDAKHSFEDVIIPVADFKARYGDRITPLGGLDVDRICRDTPDALRRYTRAVTERCFADGYWALGTGNSLTDYMPVDNYRLVLEEGRKVAEALSPVP